MQNFIASIRETDIYAEYREALEELKKDPDLKRRVAFCRMMQDMTYKITEALDFE